MNDEFKKIKSGNYVRYVLEDGGATSGGTSAGSIASMDTPIGSDQIVVQSRMGPKEPSKPRNFVAKNAKMGGAGKMKDKSKTIPRHEKHKKPVAEALGMENPDHESSMARNELYRNAKYGIAMLKMIEPGQQLEGWVESCLTKAASSLDKIYHYLDYETKFGQGVDHSEEDPEVDVEEDSGEADISRENLMLIVEYSIKLFKMIKDGDDLEGWVFMKLTKASECVSSAKHHLEYQQFKNHGLDDEYSDEETVAEGYGRYGRRDAYQRDYDASIAGMSGSRDDKFGYDDAGFSLRPGHDEGEPVYNPRYDRTRQYSSQPSTLYFYKVGPGHEQEARAVGLNQSKRGSWYSKGSRNAAADKRFGPGREVHMKEAAHSAAQRAAIAIAKKKEQGVAEVAGQKLSVQQLATISDEALDKAYGYGRSSPSNTFGWQANLKSAAYAKQMIDKGVTDIEAISDAIHKGWNVTAQAFVKNPMQFDDSKTMAPEKLQAKLAQRQKLMTQQYGQLPEDEKEKDRVVARAILQAITGGQQDTEEGYVPINKWNDGPSITDKKKSDGIGARLLNKAKEKINTMKGLDPSGRELPSYEWDSKDNTKNLPPELYWQDQYVKVTNYDIPKAQHVSKNKLDTDYYVKHATKIKELLASHGIEVPDIKDRNAILNREPVRLQQGVAEDNYSNHLAGMLENVLAERSKSKAQWDLMHAVAHNPQFANQVKIDPSVGQEFAAADAGHERSALPDRVLKTKSKKK